MACQRLGPAFQQDVVAQLLGEQRLGPGQADAAPLVHLDKAVGLAQEAFADMDRVTPGGRVQVHETRDAGATWTPRGEGLPPEDAYLTILREAFESCGEGPSLELYFGATSGGVFGSGDAGASWADVATHLPPVLSVSAR